MSGQKVRCLVIVVNRGRGEQAAGLCRSYQLYFIYGILALETAGSDLLDYLGVSEVDKELLFCRLPAQLEYEVMHRITKEIQIRKVGHGIVFTMLLSGINSLFQRKILCGRIYEGEEVEREECKYKLVIAVVEHGWRDQVMETAKEANTTGGTVLRVRSLHEDDATSFLGIRLQGKKDIVVILFVHENYKRITHEINMAVGLQTEAKGLVFSTPVDELIGM